MGGSGLNRSYKQVFVEAAGTTSAPTICRGGWYYSRPLQIDL